jgi:hypothetical protein
MICTIHAILWLISKDCLLKREKEYRKCTVTGVGYTFKMSFDY